MSVASGTQNTDTASAGVRLVVVQGNIADEAVDAIVNAANSALIRGGGVDCAIHRAAGPLLQPALDQFGGCPTGECRVTPGFRLKARAIIHCIGPVWHGGGQGKRSGSLPATATPLRPPLPEAFAASLSLRSAPASMASHQIVPPKLLWRRHGRPWFWRQSRPLFLRCVLSALTLRLQLCTALSFVGPES